MLQTCTKDHTVINPFIPAFIHLCPFFVCFMGCYTRGIEAKQGAGNVRTVFKIIPDRSVAIIWWIWLWGLEIRSPLRTLFFVGICRFNNRVRQFEWHEMKRGPELILFHTQKRTEPLAWYDFKSPPSSANLATTLFLKLIQLFIWSQEGFFLLHLDSWFIQDSHELWKQII